MDALPGNGIWMMIKWGAKSGIAVSTARCGRSGISMPASITFIIIRSTTAMLRNGWTGLGRAPQFFSNGLVARRRIEFGAHIPFLITGRSGMLIDYSLEVAVFGVPRSRGKSSEV